MKKKKHDKRLLKGMDMPSGLRKKQGDVYRPEEDEVANWISRQPELVNCVADRLKDLGYIAYDPQTGTWSGVNNLPEDGRKVER